MSIFDQNALASQLAAEKELLGQLLADPREIDKIQGVLKPEMFSSKSHERIFGAIVELHNSGRAVDPVVINSELTMRGVIEECGGSNYLSELCVNTMSSANAIEHATDIKRFNNAKNALRCLRSAEKRILEGMDAEEEINAARGILDGLLEASFCVNGDNVASKAGFVMDILEERYTCGLSTGYCALNNFRGFMPGEVIVLAARPSVGKTAFLVSLLMNLFQSNVAVKSPAFFSLEVPSDVIAMNITQSISGKQIQEIMRRGPSEEEAKAIRNASLALKGYPINIFDDCKLTVAQMTSACRILKRKDNLSLIAIDYLQLISDPEMLSPRASIYEKVSMNSKLVKQMARELDVPVILLCQLNREIEKRGDMTPRLSDLRDSGAIEQDADQIWLLSGERPQGEVEKVERTLMVAKNRNGPVGKCHFNFTPRYLRFEEKDEHL